MKFYAYYKQSGEGCDHSIGCGQKLVELEASTLAKAEAEVAAHLIGDEPEEFDPDEHHEYLMERTLIIPAVGVVEFDVDALYEECRQAAARRREVKQKAKELEQYEALSKKYGKKS